MLAGELGQAELQRRADAIGVRHVARIDERNGPPPDQHTELAQARHQSENSSGQIRSHPRYLELGSNRPAIFQ